MSVLLQTPGGDIDITLGKTTLITDPVAEGCQTLRNSFLLFLGEWFLDTRVGWPFFQQVALKNPNLSVVGNMIKRIIVSTPPFVSANVSITPPNGARRANATFVAIVDPKIVPGVNGVPVKVTASALDAPYIIVVPSVTAGNL